MVGSSTEQAQHMVQYLCAMFVLLASALITALALWPDEDIAASHRCDSLALYPVERLAARGDAGAMAYVGGRLSEQGCPMQARAYFEQAADAGLEAAQGAVTPESASVPAASPCAALLAMMMPGVNDAHLLPGACSRP